MLRRIQPPDGVATTAPAIPRFGASTRQESVRTLARSPFVVNLVEVAPLRVYRRIAFEAAELWAQGVRVAAISRHFGVDHHTVEKALRWFLQL